MRGFAHEFARRLPSGGTGRVPTTRSATTGLVYAAVATLSWIGHFMLGDEVGGSTAETVLAVAGTLLLLGGFRPSGDGAGRWRGRSRCRCRSGR